MELNTPYVTEFKHQVISIIQQNVFLYDGGKIFKREQLIYIPRLMPPPNSGTLKTKTLFMGKNSKSNCSERTS